MSEQLDVPSPPDPGGTAGRRRLSGSWLGLLVAVALVALVAAALAWHNGDYYHFWIYNDPQTDEELTEEVRVNLFMAHTSGMFWGQFVALFLGAFLAARTPGMSRALAVAVPAGVLLAVVNLAVAWQTSADARRPLAWWAENAPELVPSADPLAVDGLRGVLAAALASYPIATVAGVGLGTLAIPLLRAPAVTRTLLAGVVTVAYGVPIMIFGGFVAGMDDEPVALFAALALLPPAPVTPAVIRAAVGDHGDAFVLTMLLSGTAWAALLVTAGRLARSRRTRGRDRASSGNGKTAS